MRGGRTDGSTVPFDGVVVGCRWFCSFFLFSFGCICSPVMMIMSTKRTGERKIAVMICEESGSNASSSISLIWGSFRRSFRGGSTKRDPISISHNDSPSSSLSSGRLMRSSFRRIRSSFKRANNNKKKLSSRDENRDPSSASRSKCRVTALPLLPPSPATDCFVNSPEWTLCRSVAEIRIGVLGSEDSSKSDLVHRYLTGTSNLHHRHHRIKNHQLRSDGNHEIDGDQEEDEVVVVGRDNDGDQEDDDEGEAGEGGGRFKKEVSIDGQSHLLLIRDESYSSNCSGMHQLSQWVDAILIVFSVSSESSFSAVAPLFHSLRRSRSPSGSPTVPVILIGTQDDIRVSSGGGRVIDSDRAESLARELDPSCSYFETCATYGFNVDSVFGEACRRVIRHRNSSVVTPSSSSSSAILRSPPHVHQQHPHPHHSSSLTTSPAFTSTLNNVLQQQLQQQSCTSNGSSSMERKSPQVANNNKSSNNNTTMCTPSPSSSSSFSVKNGTDKNSSERRGSFRVSTAISAALNSPSSFRVPVAPPPTASSSSSSSAISSFRRKSKSDLVSLSDQQHQSNSHHDAGHSEASSATDGNELGVGRAIPLRQGFLYKKSTKSLNKDWKKKYCTLTSGILTYHPSLRDYMNNCHGKEIPLKHTTVKVPDRKFPVPAAAADSSASEGGKSDKSSSKHHRRNKSGSSKTAVTTTSSANQSEEENLDTDNSSLPPPVTGGTHFTIVSLDSTEWRFDAESPAERSEWVTAIQQQILSSLQTMCSERQQRQQMIATDGGTSAGAGVAGHHQLQSTPSDAMMMQRLSGESLLADEQTLREIRKMAGNDQCADCRASNPVWCSVNLGVLICIECSGIHRNVGTHVSKVRSLELDDWPQSHVSVLQSLGGNRIVNQMWEHPSFSGLMDQGMRASSTSSHDHKEKWIRSKYESKAFLKPLPHPLSLSSRSSVHPLMEAISRKDVPLVALILAHYSCSTVKTTTQMPPHALHAAAASGLLPVVQLLIWHNFDVNAIDPDGRSALSVTRNKEVADLLRKSGATTQTSPFIRSSDI